jgi:hypothetical protein
MPGKRRNEEIEKPPDSETFKLRPFLVLEIRVERGPDKKPLVAQFGGIPLQWSKWVAISDTIKPIWSERQ